MCSGSRDLTPKGRAGRGRGAGNNRQLVEREAGFLVLSDPLTGQVWGRLNRLPEARVKASEAVPHIELPWARWLKASTSGISNRPID